MSERANLQLIDERDAAEETLSQAYYLIIGHSPEWSNLFGHAEALEEIGDAVAVLKACANANGCSQKQLRAAGGFCARRKS